MRLLRGWCPITLLGHVERVVGVEQLTQLLCNKQAYGPEECFKTSFQSVNGGSNVLWH
jgi:hypothetical protein